MNKAALSTSILISASLLLTGCVANPFIKKTSLDEMGSYVSSSKNWSPVKSGNTSSGEVVYLNGKPYPVDQDGRLLVSKADLDQSRINGNKVFHPAPIAGLELSDREVQTLMADKAAFFIFMKNPTLLGPGEVSFPILKGSLEDNLIRLSEKMGLKSISYETDYDFYIPEDQLVIGKNIEEVLFTMLKGFPLEASLTEEDAESNLRIYSVGDRQNLIAFKAEKGSLKEATSELADLAGWDFEWEFTFDYLIPETTVIRGRSYDEIMSKLLQLQDYPIQASKSGEQ